MFQKRGLKRARATRVYKPLEISQHGPEKWGGRERAQARSAKKRTTRFFFLHWGGHTFKKSHKGFELGRAVWFPAPPKDKIDNAGPHKAPRLNSQNFLGEKGPGADLKKKKRGGKRTPRRNNRRKKNRGKNNIQGIRGTGHPVVTLPPGKKKKKKEEKDQGRTRPRPVGRKRNRIVFHESLKLP